MLLYYGAKLFFITYTTVFSGFAKYDCAFFCRLAHSAIQYHQQRVSVKCAVFDSEKLPAQYCLYIFAFARKRQQYKLT